MNSIRVKPLKWEQTDERCYDAKGLGIDYRIALHTTNRYYLTDRVLKLYPTLKDAQRAAQADHEKRILAAIDTHSDLVIELDLRAIMMDEIEKAAAESPRVPKEYYMKEIISDCCAFLRADRNAEKQRIRTETLREVANYITKATAAIRFDTF